MNKRFFLPLFLVLLTAISCQQTDLNKELEMLHSQIDSLSTALIQEKQRTDSLLTTFGKNSSLEEYPLFFGKKYEDIENPEEYIRNELSSRPDLIPLRPVLGGTMQFRQIEILTEEWLLAIYEDGHIQGKAIMKYDLQPDGAMEFSIVATQE